MIRPRPACLVLALAIVAPPLHAQTPDFRVPTNATTLTLGLGGGKIGMAVDAALTHRRGMHDATVRGIETLQFSLFGGGSRSVADLGVMYGIHPFANRNAIAARVGVGAVWYSIDSFGSSPQRHYGPKVGIPWELSVIAPFSDIMGVGFSVLGNVNRLQSYGVVMLTLNLGWLRREAD